MSRSRYRHHGSSFSLPALLAALLGFGLIFLVVFKYGGALTPSEFGAYDRFAVVVATPKEVRLFSFNFTAHSLSDISFPPDLYVPELTHGYGSYLLGKTYSVGELDKRGGEVLRGTVREFIGAPIEAYVVSTEAVDLENKNVFLSPGFLLGGTTNLSPLDRVRFAWGVSQVRADRRRSYNVSEVSQKLVLPDGSEAQSIEKDSLDVFLGSAFVEPTIQDEHLRLEVINTTPFAGLGTRASRILTALGGSVIMVNSQEEPVDRCVVWYDPSVKESMTLKRVVAIFNCEEKVRETPDRAEISVVLGESYVRELSQ